MADNVGIILHSGTVDRLAGAANLVAGTAARGGSAFLFVTFWALRAFARDRPAMPFGGAGETDPQELERAFGAAPIPDWMEILRQAKEIGDVTIFACSQVMEILGMSSDDLDPIVDGVIGVSGMLRKVDDAHLLFI